METMRHTFRPATPISSILIVSLFALGLVLGTDDALPLSAAGRYFFLILVPLALYHLQRIATSLQFFELSADGVISHGLFRRRLVRFAELEQVRFSRFTGDFVLHGVGGRRMAIPATCHRFADLHFALLTAFWAHRQPQEQTLAVPEPLLVLRPSLADRLHAAYSVSAPVIWAACVSTAVGPAFWSVWPLFLVGGALQAVMNFHGLSHLLNWYELGADGLVIHSLWRSEFLPANEFLTSFVRDDAQGRSLELAFFKQTVRIRLAFPLPAEEIAGMLNQRWAAQASY